MEHSAHNYYSLSLHYRMVNYSGSTTLGRTLDRTHSGYSVTVYCAVAGTNV